MATAARLSKDGVIDDYVQQFPALSDLDRLATSVRLAARIAPPSQAIAAAAPSSTNPTRRRPIVFVVEDDEALHTLVAAMLESEPIDLVFEADGAAAFDRVGSVGPDLVLMDVMLPGGDGVALTEQIKSTPDLAAIPVVGSLSGEARLRRAWCASVQAGAADFIVKPFTRESLIAKLTKHTCRRPPDDRRQSAPQPQAEVTGMPRNCPATAGPAGARIALGIEAIEQLAFARPRDRQARQLDVAVAANLLGDA